MHPLQVLVLVAKNAPVNAGDARDVGSIPGSRRSPGGGNGNPLQYSCLENPMDRAAWWAPIHRVAKSWTRPSTQSRLQSSVQRPAAQLCNLPPPLPPRSAALPACSLDSSPCAPAVVPHYCNFQSIEKAREFQKNTYFCFIDYTKALDCVDHNRLWKILKEMGIPAT